VEKMAMKICKKKKKEKMISCKKEVPKDTLSHKILLLKAKVKRRRERGLPEKFQKANLRNQL
jgi:hypothetical protein